ncbi:hypothetical protein [Streptococcus oricebi]|uniref:Uncharacterized protein n=1 Tax=Streptococcus oricebi TaxID=1547447 RepID=A0ABS5B3C7_9STRE|nr:hypothetical protein [Streptococcus oricebi]MBP2623348.1 hypothetical protein [Streptococcus oricebi]
MKKTIFNASLEESMNFVKDDYIKTSLDDINQKGVKKKVLGFFTVLLLISFNSAMGDIINDFVLFF